MAKQADDRARLVAAAANRLRLIQIDFADEQPDVRRSYLEEAVEGALAEIVPEQREAFLKELMARFPTWDPNVAVAPQRETAVRSRTDEAELQDPSFLVERLIGLAPQISDNEKRGLARRLQEAGLAPRAQGGIPEDAVARLLEVVGLKPGTPIDVPATMGLLASLAEFVSSLDPLVWRTWAKLAPTSRFQSTATLRATLAKLISAEESVDAAKAEEEVLMLRHMLAAVVVGLGQSGKIAATDVATGFMAPLTPAKIEDLVKFEKGSIFVAQEVKCWRKYKELAGKLTDVAIEGAIRDKIQRFVEELMKRRASTQH